MPPVCVTVEYCEKCGYKPYYEELEAMILDEVPEATMVPKEGGTGTFEITVNDVMIFSKIRNLSFPNYDAVVKVVHDAYEGKEIQQVTQTQGMCKQS